MGRPMYEGEVRGRERAETRSQVKRETGKLCSQTVLYTLI